MITDIQDSLGEASFDIVQCTSSEIYGPTLQAKFTLYYILEGKGEYTVFGRKYKLGEGYIFIIMPNFTFSLKVDKHHPWKMAAITFDGVTFLNYLSTLDLTIENPIRLYDVDKYLHNLTMEMAGVQKLPDYIGKIKLMGLILLFFGRMMEFNTISNVVPRTREEIYIRDTINFIHNNYMSKLSVNEISKFIGLDRTYFSKIIKNHLGVSPQQYIIQYKIEKACEMLAKTSLGIGYIGGLVGYSDYFAFSKAFKKVKGISPVSFRKSFMQRNKDIEENYLL